MKWISLVAIVAGVASACGGEARSAEVMVATGTGDSVRFVPVKYERSPATRLAVSKWIPWTVSFDSAGPLRPGMSLARAIIVLEGDLWQVDGSVRCSYFRAARAPGLEFVFLNRLLARIEIDSGPVATAAGMRIGSTEEQVQAAYAGHVVATDDVYSGGRVLTVRAPIDADSALNLVFETDSGKVVRYRVGVRPAVGWAEGCS
jgi:hypothetical protein